MMANRLLTAFQIMQLCPWADYVDVADTPWTLRYGTARMDIMTGDRIMKDEEFIEKYSIMRGQQTTIKNAYRVPSEVSDERGKTHGDYDLMSFRIQEIKTAMRRGNSWEQMSAGQREALELIATKIGRIVCGDPNCHDHWTDIVGYATLALQRIAYKSKG